MLEQYGNRKAAVAAVDCAKQSSLLANKKPIPCHACDAIDGKKLKQRIDKMKKIEDVLEELKRQRVSDIGRQAGASFKKTPLKHCNAAKLNLPIRCQHFLDRVK
jgi:tetrahydromethanopterin S-methyltransferase subunit G